MTFTMKHKVPPTPNNKGGVKDGASNFIDTKYVLYKYKRGDKSKGFVLKPRIDFLVVTIPVKDPDTQGLILKALGDDLYSLDEGDIVAFNVSNLSGVGKGLYQYYKQSIQIKSFPGLLAIQAEPNNKTHNFLKITMIPSRWSRENVKAFWDYIYDISGGTIDSNVVATKGNVTRIDWAIDFINVDTSDLYPQKLTNNPRKKVAYVGVSGGVETYYIGPNSEKAGPQNFKAYIYDKLAKDQQLGNEPEFNFLHTRFEIRLMKDKIASNSLKSLANLSDKIANRFEPYSMIDFHAVDPIRGHELWHCFGDSCKLRGVDGAMDMVNFANQKAFKKMLLSAEKECWRPEKLWEATKDHVNFILGND